jgi:crossover junction endodeoxyribonuclease RuvC
MVVMGVDPGSTATGFGVISVERGRLCHRGHGVLRVNGSETLPRRLSRLFEGLKRILREHKPGALAIEAIFHARNARSSLILGHARGVLLLAAIQEGLEPVEYTPLEVKQALTGFGQATKEQIRYMVQALLSLKEPVPLDASDALAVAICHAHCLGMREVGGRRR